MFDDYASRDASRIAACAPQSVTSAGPWCLKKSPAFPHNLPPVSVLYFVERPEMTTQRRGPKKAKTTKPKQKETTTMKTKLTKIIMSSLAFTFALVCLVAVIAVGTSATTGPAGIARPVRDLRGMKFKL